TLLIRHRVRADVERAGGWKIAVLYAVNTAGAATGAFLTDFALIPASGLPGAQLVAVALNLVAGSGALLLSRFPARVSTRLRASDRPRQATPTALEPRPTDLRGWHRQVTWTCMALTLSGFAAMGMEILWLRHFHLLLGGFRAVFSLVLTVMLAGIGAGSVLG